MKATGAQVAIHANAYPEKPMTGVRLKDVTIEARSAGEVANAADWSFEGVTLRLLSEGPVKLENCEGVPQPETAPLERSEWEEARKHAKEAGEHAIRLGAGVGGDDE